MIVFLLMNLPPVQLDPQQRDCGLLSRFQTPESSQGRILACSWLEHKHENNNVALKNRQKPRHEDLPLESACWSFEHQ